MLAMVGALHRHEDVVQDTITGQQVTVLMKRTRYLGVGKNAAVKEDYIVGRTTTAGKVYVVVTAQ